MGGFRWVVAIAIAVGLVIYLEFQSVNLILLVLGEVVVITLLFFITMKPVDEPYRAVVYRLAKFHHLDGPGYVFLVPTFDKIGGRLDMSSREVIPIEVPQIRTAENEQVRTNLEVTWRIHPDVNGRVTAKVKSMLLMKPPQQIALISEVVISMARQVVSSYTLQQLASAANREVAAATMRDGSNEILEDYGIEIERVFWRGSPANAKVMEAITESAVAAEHAKSLIKTVEAIRTHLPDMQPEEFLALQAWLDMFRRGGGSPPAASR